MIQKSLILVFLFSFSIYSQEILKVIAAKGKPTIKIGANSTLLNPGDKIFNHGTIITSELDYLSLISKNGVVFEITAKGSYNTKDIEAKVNQKKNFSEKFGKYIYEKLTEETDDSKSKKMFGAVVRSTSEHLLVELPLISFYDEDSIYIKWNRATTDTSFLLKFLNAENRILYVHRTPLNNYWLDINKMKLRAGESYKLIVNSNGEKSLASDTIKIKIPERKVVNDLKSDFANYELNNNSPLDLIQTALIYEKSGFNNLAKKHLQAANSLAPGVDQYTQIYNLFLLKNGLDFLIDTKTLERR